MVADEQEVFTLEFRPENSYQTLASFQLRYLMTNGYALHEEEYGLLHPGISQKNEYTWIGADHPVGHMELVVRFPGFIFNPLPDKVWCEAIYLQNPEQGQLTGRDILSNRRCIIDREETDFLTRSHAIKIRPELDEIALHVERPRMDRLYLLRWRVPRLRWYLPLGEDPARNKFQSLVNQFNKVSSSELQQQCDRIASSVRDVQGGDKNLHCMLFGWVKDQGLLKVTAVSDTLQPLMNLTDLKPLFIGRDVVGKAFRTGDNQIWCVSGDSRFRHNHMDKVFGSLEPKAVLAVPLRFPDPIIFPDEYDRIALHVDFDHAAMGSYRYHCYGVACVLATNVETSPGQWIAGLFKLRQLMADRSVSRDKISEYQCEIQGLEKNIQNLSDGISKALFDGFGTKNA